MRSGTIPGVHDGRGGGPIPGVHDGQGEGGPSLGAAALST